MGTIVAHRELDDLGGLGDGQLYPLTGRRPTLLYAQALVLPSVVYLGEENGETWKETQGVVGVSVKTTERLTQYLPLLWPLLITGGISSHTTLATLYYSSPE